MALTIHDRNDDGTLEIMDTNWETSEADGVLRVTVRDMSYSGRDNTAAMRRLARSAAEYPVKSSRVIRRFPAPYDREVEYVTFAVARR